MIIFKNNSPLKPFRTLRQKYNEAQKAGQKSIEAICISSFDAKKRAVDARFVNLKIIDDSDFIFFSNYESEKSAQFKLHNKIAATLFWNSINVQIRFKAEIKKTSKAFNNEYFSNRSADKNALAISSNQSKVIESYNLVKDKYQHVRTNKDLRKCPSYWGGYSFTPYEIEFWTGHKNRLNKRDLFIFKSGNWDSFILEP